MLLTKLGCKDDIALVEAIAGKGATQYAQLAHIVFDAAEQGDKVALKIVTEGAEYINTIARILWKKSPVRMSMIGGMTAKLRPWLDTEVQAWLSEPLNTPEVGSVFFARSEMTNRTLLKI
jgi:glucosamine kinase